MLYSLLCVLQKTKEEILAFSTFAQTDNIKSKQIILSKNLTYSEKMNKCVLLRDCVNSRKLLFFACVLGHFKKAFSSEMLLFGFK